MAKALQERDQAREQEKKSAEAHAQHVETLLDNKKQLLVDVFHELSHVGWACSLCPPKNTNQHGNTSSLLLGFASSTQTTFLFGIVIFSVRSGCLNINICFKGKTKIGVYEEYSG